MLTILRFFFFKAFRTTGAVAIYTGKKRNSNRDQNKEPKQLEGKLKTYQPINIVPHGFFKKYPAP